MNLVADVHTRLDILSDLEIKSELKYPILLIKQDWMLKREMRWLAQHPENTQGSEFLIL